jgi:Family of unknown function (DUF6445)
MSSFTINPNASISRIDIEVGRFFCVVVDDFLFDPAGVIDYAKEHAGKFNLQERGYPGTQMVPEESKLRDIQGFVRKKLSQEMNYCRTGTKLAAVFSMITLPPEDLNWAQRMCHTDPNMRAGYIDVAGLVYLFKDPQLGGTGFYRFRNPQMIEHAIGIAETDMAGALAYLKEHLPMYREPSRYLTDSCEAAELILTVPPRFNRAIFFGGHIPHNASIGIPQLLANDVNRGRLTLNFYVSAVPK